MQYITQSCRAFRPKGDLHDTTFTLPEFLKSRNGLVAEAIGKRTRKNRALADGAALGTAEAINLDEGAGGADRDRTGDPLLAKQVLSQLSYSPGESFRPAPSRLLEGWWVWMDSNHRPPPYQDGALTN